ncbi:DASH family cryptochrome, partial [Pseudoalteromonas sp. S4741]
MVFKSVMQDTLYQKQQLPFEHADLQTGFTPFIKKIEDTSISLSAVPFSATSIRPPINICANQPISA